MKRAAAIISIILGVVLLVCLGFGVYVLLESTNYCKNWATDFWVTIDGQRYYVDSDELVLFDTDVDVHYLVEWLSNKQGYTYQVLPAGDEFGYSVDGYVSNWLGIEDLTPAFEFVESEKGFTIKARAKTVADVLQVLYPDSEIVTAAEDEGYNYKLVVTSIDGKSIELTFRCAVAVDGIEINPPSIIVQGGEV